MIGTGRDNVPDESLADQGDAMSSLTGILQQLSAILADYSSAAETGELTAADVVRWQQLAAVYAQIIALLG